MTSADYFRAMDYKEFFPNSTLQTIIAGKENDVFRKNNKIVVDARTLAFPPGWNRFMLGEDAEFWLVGEMVESKVQKKVIDDCWGVAGPKLTYKDARVVRQPEVMLVQDGRIFATGSVKDLTHPSLCSLMVKLREVYSKQRELPFTSAYEDIKEKVGKRDAPLPLADLTG